MADWLCDVVTGCYDDTKPSEIASCSSSNYSAPTYPCPEFATSATQTSIPHTRSTIHPSPAASIPEGFEDAGAGRLVTFNDAQPLPKLIDFIGQGVGLPGGIPIAIPQSKSVDDIHIRTVGMCPGSGSGVLMRGDLPDLLFTGEMSHHEALAATERGSVVISLAHSNSERGYLHAVMRNKLLQDLSQRWHAEREAAIKGASEEDAEVFRDAEVSVSVSEADRDPYGIMIRR